MNQGIRLILYPVKDLAQARQLFGQLLGIKPYMDAPYYVGFRVGDQEIGLDPYGHNKGMTGPVGYYQVDDIKKSLQMLEDSGAKAHEEIKDVGGGKLTASVQDTDGNIIALVQNP